MLNKYRQIKYTDDGCDLFECLSCHAQWEARYFPDKFCGNCGIAFTRLDCISRDEKFYHYRGMELKEPYCISKEPEKYLVVQERFIDADGEILEDWKDYCKSLLFADNSDRGPKKMKGILEYLRNRDAENVQSIELEDGYKVAHYEYRVVLKSAASIPAHSNVYTWR